MLLGRERFVGILPIISYDTKGLWGCMYLSRPNNMLLLFILLWLTSDYVTASVLNIVGGNTAVNRSYPYFVLDLQPNGKFFCGGTLVSPEFVLTAAHCAIGSYSLVRVLIGALCPSQSDNFDQYSEYQDVKAIFAHPNYDSVTNANDFAVVQLTKRSMIKPVSLDQGNISTNYTLGKRNLFTAGFGRTSATNASLFPNRLMEVELAYVPQDTCKAQNGGALIVPSMMCAYNPGQDSCNGDSGGPLFDADNNVQVGVVSWGYSPCASSFPGVYARIADQWSWIRDTVCANHSSPQPVFCPSSSPSPQPSMMPSMTPSLKTSSNPTAKPSLKPSANPSAKPLSIRPSRKPSSAKPLARPSLKPSSKIIAKPSLKPSVKPTAKPSSIRPSRKPSLKPLVKPTVKPSLKPSAKPSAKRSSQPSEKPTAKSSVKLLMPSIAVMLCLIISL